MAKVAQKLGSLVQKGPAMAKGVVSFSRPRLQTFWKYARVEMKPPSFADIPQIQQGFQNIVVSARTGKWKQLTTREAWLNSLVAFEIMCWFFVGEIIGKGNLVGYYIPGAVHYEPMV